MVIDLTVGGGLFLIYIYFFYRECVKLVDAYPRDVVFYDPGLVRARLTHHLCLVFPFFFKCSLFLATSRFLQFVHSEMS